MYKNLIFVCKQSSGSLNAFYWLSSHLSSCRQNMISITKVKDNLVTKGVNLITCRRIGRCSNPMRSILIRFGTFEDKMKFLTCNMNDLHKNAMAVNYTIKLDSFNYEKTQNMFCSGSKSLFQ